jgi:cysteine desulfurase
VIYLDYNATTPVDPRVLEAMLPLFTERYANAASKHAAGRSVAELVERARHQVAELLGTQQRHLVFTSGATEAAALAIRGVTASAEPGQRRILVSAAEHKAVLAAADAAARDHGGSVGHIRVRRDGSVDLDHLRGLLAEDVAVVAVMAANNETGVVNDLPGVVRLARRFGVPVCCDATQAVGRIPVALDDWGVDLAVASAHKLYGPKGIGVLAVRRTTRARLTPLIAGGGQERGLRGGTVNTPGVVGFGRAAQLARAALDDERQRQQRLVHLLYLELAARVALDIHGQGALRLPNTLSVRFPGAPADAVLACLPDVLVSSGAACQSGSDEPSHVLLAMGLEPAAALETIRFSIGRPTTEQEIRTAAVRVADAVDRARALNRNSHHRKAST